MDITISKSAYNAPPETREDSIHQINFWRKRITIILILGTIILLVVLANFFFLSPPKNIKGLYSVRSFRSDMESFLFGCACPVGAVICAFMGRQIRPSEEINENNELIQQQKRWPTFSLGLFLVSDVMLILLSGIWVW